MRRDLQKKHLFKDDPDTAPVVDVKLTMDDLSYFCKKCQACCKYIEIPTPLPWDDETFRDYLTTRNFEIKKGDVGNIEVVIYQPCSHLTESGCDVYEDRPSVCRMTNGLEACASKCAWSVLNPAKVYEVLLNNNVDELNRLKEEQDRLNEETGADKEALDAVNFARSISGVEPAEEITSKVKEKKVRKNSKVK